MSDDDRWDTVKGSRVCLALAAAMLLIAGCGSTLEPSGRVTVGGARGESTGSASVGMSPGGSVGSGAFTGTAGGGDAGNPSDGGTAPAGPGVGIGSGASTGDSSGAVTVGGSDATSKPPVKVGIEYVGPEGGAAAAAAFGVSGVSPGDQKDAYQILINDLNRRGGLNGHKIVPVWFSYDAAGSDTSTQEESMCAAFTQDNKVFAALLLSITTSTARTCLQKAGVAMIGGSNGSTADAQTFRAYPLYTTSGSVSWTRLADVYVDGLAQQGFFSKNAKVGVITADDPVFTRTADGPLRRALRRNGLSVSDEVRVTPAYTVGAIGASSAAIQNAVLRFNTEGITHVLFIEPVGGGANFFMMAADKQNYRPRYGLTTNDELTNLESLVPHSQLAGALGVGWIPLKDLVNSLSQVSPAGRGCLERLRAAGNNPPDQPAMASALVICDQVSIFAAAARAGGPGLSASAYLRGLDSLGQSIPSATVLGLNYGAGRRDGLSRVRHLAFASSCDCFRYVGAPYSI